jgi:hypothetical protein
VKSFIFFALAATAFAQVTHWEKQESRVALSFAQGTGILEWVTDSSFRYLRSWDVPLRGIERLSQTPVVFEAEEQNGRIVLRSANVIVEIPRETGLLEIRRRGGNPLLTELKPATRDQNRISLERSLAGQERISGLMYGLAMRNTQGTTERARYLSNLGYGEVISNAREVSFDIGKSEPGKILFELRGAPYLETFFTADPAAKGTFEEWASYLGDSWELKQHYLEPLRRNQLPSRALLADSTQLSTWKLFEIFFRRLSAWSMTDVLYPAVDTKVLKDVPEEIRRRAGQLIALFPIVVNSGDLTPQELSVRKSWTPYLITYAREAHDRGFPIWRPIAMQFPRDAARAGIEDVIMLGDELLLVPQLDAVSEREVDLPMGIWMDWHTGRVYPGRQRTHVPLAKDHLTILVKNGSLVPYDPLAEHRRMELHYFPNIGGEFFLWEPEPEQNTQFHASPAADAIRLEIESKVTRTYEWIVRQSKRPKTVVEGATVYKEVTQAQLAPNTWFYDSGRQELHVVVKGDAGADPIIMVTF